MWQPKQLRYKFLPSKSLGGETRSRTFLHTSMGRKLLSEYSRFLSLLLDSLRSEAQLLVFATCFFFMFLLNNYRERLPPVMLFILFSFSVVLFLLWVLLIGLCDHWTVYLTCNFWERWTSGWQNNSSSSWLRQIVLIPINPASDQAMALKLPCLP